MKKILLFLSFLVVQANLSAQNINISFEEDEDFELGQLAGQNNWLVPLTTITNLVNIDDDKSTDGDWSVHLEGNPNGPLADNALGIVVSPILATGNRNKFSVDLYIEADEDLNPSEFNVIVESSTQQLIAARVVFFDGDIFLIDTNPVNPQQLIFVQAGTYTENSWFELEIVLKTDTDQIEYSIDEDLFYTGDLIAADEFDLVVLASSFNQTGVYVDNIIISQDNLSIDNPSLESFSVYPNPTQDILNFQLNSNQIIQQIEVFDISGKKVLTSQTKDPYIDVRNLKAGNYLLKVELENSQQMLKFIKQ